MLKEETKKQSREKHSAEKKVNFLLPPEVHDSPVASDHEASEEEDNKLAGLNEMLKKK